MDGSTGKIQRFNTKEELEEARKKNPNLLPVRICDEKHRQCSYQDVVDDHLLCKANRQNRRRMGCR